MLRLFVLSFIICFSSKTIFKYIHYTANAGAALRQSNSPLSGGCTTSKRYCTLRCLGDYIYTIEREIQPIVGSCYSGVYVELTNLTFWENKLQRDFFEGNFQLRALNIANSELIVIEHKTFAQKSTKFLQNLTLINVNHLKLNATTFEGLENLNHFQLQGGDSCALEAKGFLKIFSENLKSLILQYHECTSTFTDLSVCFDGATMKSLTDVNLAGNAFYIEPLHKTLSSLSAVEILNLSYCGLPTLPVDVFNPVLKTLKYLDLRFNYLHNLPGEMLMAMSGVYLDIGNNQWDCSCQNRKMIQIIKENLTDNVFLNRNDIRCHFYEGFYTTNNLPMDEIVLDCAMFSDEYSSTQIGSIQCKVEENNRTIYESVMKEVCKVSFVPLSETSIKIIVKNLAIFPAILYYSNLMEFNTFTDMEIENQMYVKTVNNLDATTNYVFCCLPQPLQTQNETKHFNWYTRISPFNCRSYSGPNILPKVWLTKQDKVWFFICATIGVILMMILGILVVFITLKMRNRRSKKRNEIPNQSMDKEKSDCTVGETNEFPKLSAHLSQFQPPNFVVQQESCHMENHIYEEPAYKQNNKKQY